MKHGTPLFDFQILFDPPGSGSSLIADLSELRLTGWPSHSRSLFFVSCSEYR